MASCEEETIAEGAERLCSSICRSRKQIPFPLAIGHEAASAIYRRPFRSHDALEIWQLYDIKADIGESKDLAEDRPEMVRTLSGEFMRWHESVLNDPTRGVSVRGGQ